MKEETMDGIRYICERENEKDAIKAAREKQRSAFISERVKAIAEMPTEPRAKQD